MIVIGVTGSIGMGKSTVTSMLQRLGVPTHDADAEVHQLLAPKGKGYKAVARAFPYYSYPGIYGRTWKGGRYIKRQALGKIVFRSEVAREKLEAILHPLVREAQAEFIRKMRRMGKKIVALDIPLLFETGGESLVHAVFVASAPYDVQRERVMARPGMDDKKFREILKRQMPDGEKRARGDYVIHTGLGRAHSMREIKAALRDLKTKF